MKKKINWREKLRPLHQNKRNRYLIIAAVLVVGVATLLTTNAATKTILLDLSRARVFNESGKVSYSGGSINFAANTTPPSTSYNVNDWLTDEAIPGLNPAEGSWPVGSLGNFRFQCWASHMSYDDPIVYPGVKGAAHLHMFFGNRNLTYQTTSENITKSGDGSCAGGPLNRTGYWIPALMDSDNKVRIPLTITFYYKTQGIKTTDVVPYPTGLRMINGNGNATSSQNDWHIQWQCRDGVTQANIYEPAQFSTIPNCPVGNYLKLQFSFPQCGAKNTDGTPVLDSPDHKSHMTYQPDTHVCPASHPIAYPEVSLNMMWKITGTPTDNWYISSDRMGGANKDGGTTTHADWMMGWDTDIMKTFVSRCLNEGRNSNQGNLCNGKRLKMISGPNGGEYTGSQIVDKPTGTDPVFFAPTF